MLFFKPLYCTANFKLLATDSFIQITLEHHLLNITMYSQYSSWDQINQIWMLPSRTLCSRKRDKTCFIFIQEQILEYLTYWFSFYHYSCHSCCWLPPLWSTWYLDRSTLDFLYYGHAFPPATLVTHSYGRSCNSESIMAM